MFTEMQSLCSNGSTPGISPAATGRVAEWLPICSISAYTHSPDTLTLILWISAFMARISVCPVSESTEARISFASWIFFSQSMIWCLQRQERQCQGRSSLSWRGREPPTSPQGFLTKCLSSLETDRLLHMGWRREEEEEERERKGGKGEN